MTIAAVASFDLTFEISSADRSAAEAGWAVSPFGPLLSTLPCMAARAASAVFDTLLFSVVEVVVAALQPVATRAIADAAAIRGSFVFIGLLHGGGRLRRRRRRAGGPGRSCSRRR